MAHPFDRGRRATIADRCQHVLHRQPTISPVVVLILTAVVFALLNDRFIQPANLSLLLQQVTVVGTLALGEALILLTAGIDLSVGAIAVLTSILLAKLSSSVGLPGPLAVVVGLVLGAGMGALNGFLVSRVKLPPFLVTLSTLSIYLALTNVISDGQTVLGNEMPAFMTWTGSAISFGAFQLTYGSLIMLVLYAVFAYALRMTAWGRHVYALGDDREAARLAGIRSHRVLLSVYTAAGGIYAIGAWILIGRLVSASPTVGADLNLNAITAVVLGGISLFGGRGRIAGALVGALIVGAFTNGLQLAGVQVVWQGFAVGVLVLLAVATDQWIRRVRA